MDGACSPPRCASRDHEKRLGGLGATRRGDEYSPLVSNSYQGCSCPHGLQSPGLLLACGYQASFLRADPDPEPSAERPSGPSGEGEGRRPPGAPSLRSGPSALPALSQPQAPSAFTSPPRTPGRHGCVCLSVCVRAHAHLLSGTQSSSFLCPLCSGESATLKTTWSSARSDEGGLGWAVPKSVQSFEACPPRALALPCSFPGPHHHHPVVCVPPSFSSLETLAP